MIEIIGSHDAANATPLVAAAFARSLGRGAARMSGAGEFTAAGAAICAIVDCPDLDEAALAAWRRAGARKLIVFGRLPNSLRTEFGFVPAEPLAPEQARSSHAPSFAWRESAARVVYGPRAEALDAPGRGWSRAFERFDFTDEWNNLGFGAIRADGTIWALSESVKAPASVELAAVEADGRAVGTYAVLADAGAFGLLWFNRPAGPIDSFEWRLVENFLSGYRAGELPCMPVISEIPWGHDAAVTMRLDCDEDVESARPLMTHYRSQGVPFSAAITTHLLAAQEHRDFLHEILAASGAVLSHSMTHAPGWGGSRENALREARGSAAAIAEVTGAPPRYAVSPFHDTPLYSLQALAESGLSGCIGGSIRTNPEFNLARGGAVAGLPDGFVGHSQQCMLHGDCMLAEGDRLAVFKQAFALARQSRTLFGYLDHPFSARYHYGWPSEEDRIAAHAEFIAHIRAQSRSPLFLSEDAALDFLRLKAGARLVDEEHVAFAHDAGAAAGLTLAIEFKGRTYPARRAGGCA